MTELLDAIVIEGDELSGSKALSASPTPTEVLTAVEEYRGGGVAVCRVQHGKKRPTDTSWTTRSYEAHDFKSRYGVGLQCGWLSDGGQPGRFLVCVDLDDPGSIPVADRLLPATGAIEGRPGKARSHRWYYVSGPIPEWAESKAPDSSAAAARASRKPGPKIRHFKNAESGNGMFDFIGTGGQAVAPPSLHSSGERRRWEEGCDISQAATLPFEELWSAVRKFAEVIGAEFEKSDSSAAVEEMAEEDVVDEHGTAEKEAEKSKPEGAKPKRAKGACVRRLSIPMEERERQCERYLLSVDLARSGQGGHQTTYRVAKLICNDFAVTDPELARRLMRAYNERLKDAKEETWSEGELAHKIDDAIKALDGPYDPRFPFGCKLATPSDRDGGAQRWGDPSPPADAFVQHQPVLFFSGRYFVFNGRNYDEVDANTLKARVWSFLEAEARRLDPEQPPKVTRALRDGVVAAIEARGVARLSGREHEVAFNAWLPGTGRTGDTLVVRNGLLDVQTSELSEHTPDFFGLYSLPYDHDSAAVCPTWDKAVDRICGDDTELKRLVQQWFGYCLTTSTDQQRFMVLVGEGANGKSTLVGGLLAVIGGANASHVALEKFSGPFDLGYSLGKLVNVPDDMSEIDKANEGVLKTYTSGGAMGFNQKNRPILSARPTAKLLFSTNTVPRFSDRSSGLWRRLLLVPLSVVIPEAERVKGMDKPSHWEKLGETAGMLNWALAGLRSLSDTNGFVIPACVRLAVAEHQLESNPTRQFITEHVEEAEGEAIRSSELFNAYTTWMVENHYKAMGHGQFTKELRRIFTGAKRENRRFKDEKNSVKAVIGVRRIAGPAEEASQG